MRMVVRGEMWQHRNAPLEKRRALLQQLVPADLPNFLRSRQSADGAALLQHCELLKLEGIVAKRNGSPYRPGCRSDDWLKIRTEYGQGVIQERMQNARAL
jgi:ATP-dependent DNA ligase